MLQVDELEGKPQPEELIKRIRDFFLNLSRPKCFNPYDEMCVLINEEREFEEICNSMEDNGVSDVKGSTVFEFYAKVQYLEKKSRKIKEHVAGK